ncbi:5'-methylthioadenosine/adenosylhomocysteine nucleosidase [Ruminococcaceae bacterium OttesenSCG-928-O06]|nr:5'-methylthioadenosine/adenosylhomocysteine nucleosidase [Ruminococcaceae bacterium OttesenSCG-928-O06]
MKKIGVMGAFNEEVELIVGAVKGDREEEYAGVLYHHGRRAGKDLVVCCGGMGKVNAASTAQVLISHFGVDAIIFSGVAGNMSKEIGIGDVVIGKELVHHDGEDRMFAQSAPFTAVYTAHPLLVDAAQQACRLTGVRHLVGRIATGDQFVGDAATKRAIQQKCHPACVEMEGAAVGQVAMRNGVPFVVLRAMSDDAEESIETLGAELFDVSEYVKTATAILLATVDALARME